MAVLERTTSSNGETGIETHPSKSLETAVKMALATSNNKVQQRKEFSAALVKESRDLGAYIIGKRTRKAR
jgi:hypothetical protein